MSLNRFAKKTDGTQADIVAGLRALGVATWIISRPCDLLTYWKGRWLPLECKPLKKRARKDQESQDQFVATYHVPIVRTLSEAYTAVTGRLLCGSTS